jgi:hypothetical protein
MKTLAIMLSEEDDGALTSDQVWAIRKLSSATNTLDEHFTERLF